MKTVVITGATSGIGLAVTGELLSLGYRVLGIGHSEKNCKTAMDTLNAQFKHSELVFFTADLMQQRQVNRVAEDVCRYLDEHCGGQLYALINNAGCVRRWYATTEEGYEQQFALNHLAGFLLTYRLLPYLKKAHGRILFTSSASHKGLNIHWKDVMMKDGYNPLLSYKQSKLCNLLFAKELNSRLAAEGIRAYAVDPGLVKTDIGLKQTGGLVSFVWSLRKKHGQPPAVPAKTFTHLCEQELKPDGLYYFNCLERDYSRHVNERNAKLLFELSEQLCGIDYGGIL